MMSKQIAFLLAIFVLCALFVIAERTFSPSFQQGITTAEENPSAFGVTVSYARCTARMLQSYEALISALATMVIAAFTGTP
jgi:vacuolar-type H+-ATPase subunit I/STV1